MLAVHWAPVSKTKSILKNGITKSGNGLYCFPLTGHPSLDRWWIQFFNQCRVRERKKYNGIVFRIKQEDMPAQFGHWVGATTKDDYVKEIATVKQLGLLFRETMVFRLGEVIATDRNIGNDIVDSDTVNILFMHLGEEALQQSPNLLAEKRNDLGFMTHALEDYQISLSKSISPDRIIKVLPQGDEFGKVIRLKKKYRE
jgi:hypothetical protein